MCGDPETAEKKQNVEENRQALKAGNTRPPPPTQERRRRSEHTHTRTHRRTAIYTSSRVVFRWQVRGTKTRRGEAEQTSPRRTQKGKKRWTENYTKRGETTRREKTKKWKSSGPLMRPRAADTFVCMHVCTSWRLRGCNAAPFCCSCSQKLSSILFIFGCYYSFTPSGVCVLSASSCVCVRVCVCVCVCRISLKKQYGRHKRRRACTRTRTEKRPGKSGDVEHRCPHSRHIEINKYEHKYMCRADAAERRPR